ncbi:hypothetical protein [Streptomyces yaizuensis]|uniref:LysM peptidoglycan-binding domain-containing protein n=1 Tax=Streptomyces yaizuensis TaxID=2989713 RepID=A0ABQ5NRZ2_9ACTN|nr:hypothetical protein [Streptomyces sp. YSPA8]GLF93124.1 LysM peptidoglycan-binding domain-containing protein [Streptomyces sp. YSPA8]
MIEPYESALDTVPGAHPYPRSSRYHETGIGVHVLPDGTPVRYLRRRLLPPLEADDGEEAGHTVREGERVDHLGQRYLGDPGQWWRIADANPVLDPGELTGEPGRQIRVPGPGGFHAG